MDVGDATAAVIALATAGATYSAWRLGQRGQKQDEKQQTAATRLQERIAAFDELESINDRLGAENARLTGEVDRLRGLIAEAEATGNMRLAQQAHRCRERLDELVASMASLQAVVVSEVARTAAQDAGDRAAEHVRVDHPDEQPDL